MYLNVYVPQLQREQGVASFFRFHRGHQFASGALMDPISKTFVAALEAFAGREQVPVIQFRKSQRKPRPRLISMRMLLFIASTTPKRTLVRQ
jgi:hypothetical protein